MVGQAEHYVKAVPFNVTRLAGIPTTILGSVGSSERDADVIGIVRGDSEAWRHRAVGQVVGASDTVNRLRLLVGEHSLLGAVVMGDQRLSRLVYRLVAGQVELGELREKLLKPGAPIEALLSEMAARLGDQGGR